MKLTINNMIDLMGYSVLVDNEEQARKLQEIAFEQGFEWKYGDEKIKNLDERSFQFGYGDEKIITVSMSRRHYQDKYITKKAHFNDLFDTLEQQLEKAKAEVERIEKEIENNKIKVGDWVCIKESDTIFKVKGTDFEFMDSRHKKITNPQLIDFLENEIK